MVTPVKCGGQSKSKVFKHVCFFLFCFLEFSHLGGQMQRTWGRRCTVKIKKHCKLNSAPGRGQSLFEMIWLENLDNCRNRELQGSQWITQTMKELKM